MNVTQSRVSQIERAEERGSIRLSTLIRTAAALDCRLVYALVPVASLEDMVMRQSFLKAGEQLGDFGSHDEDDECREATRSEQHEVLALEWVDHRGLWTDAKHQPGARAGPDSPGPAE
jgi:transcriptional regulator with XRE-family HTH domain